MIQTRNELTPFSKQNSEILDNSGNQSGSPENNTTTGILTSNGNSRINFDIFSSQSIPKQYVVAEDADPIAANESGKVWGDPHFVGGDGGKFDVQGESGKIYNILSDTCLNLNAQFEGLREGVTIVGETGLVLGQENSRSILEFNKDGVAKLNDQELTNGETVDLADGGTATLNGNTLVVKTKEGYEIKQTVKNNHIDIDVSTGENGVDHGEMPGGLLGRTFDADALAQNGKKGKGAQGEGAIEGTVGDYEVDSLTYAPESDQSLQTGDLLRQLQQTLALQERTSLMTNMMKVMHDISTSVINAFR